MRHNVGIWVCALVAGLLAGCGGGSTVSRSATVTGSVLDINFDEVRDARVYANGVETFSSPSGVYQLLTVETGIVEIIAEIVQNGVTYRGRNAVLNFENTQTNNCNIIVAPVSELGRITGNVKDLQGLNLEGASVFAFNGTGSSQRAFTDRNGNYVLADLVGGVSYRLSAGGSGFSSAQTDITVVAGQARTANFTVDDAGLPFLDPPQNLSGISWVSPNYAVRSAGTGNPYAWIKQLHDKRQRPAQVASKTRALRDDLIVEVDLFWDVQQFPDLLGYGIYRVASAVGPVAEYDFIAEPLAGYYVDIGPNVNTTYSYALTTLSTLFPDFNSTESDLSNRAVVDTLDRLSLGPVFVNPVQFTWSSFSRAEEFIVYVFDQFPGVGVQAFWDNSGNPTTGTSLDYTGPSLVAGHTYFYVVLGLANGGSSRTISEIGSFQP